MKSLLAEAPDVAFSHERDFNAPCGWERERIVLFKRPAQFREAWSYPLIPTDMDRVIVLTRPRAQFVESFRRMEDALGREQWPWCDLAGYWHQVTVNLMRWHARCEMEPWVWCARMATYVCRSQVVTYGQLVADPVGITHQLLQWMESEATTGFDTYRPRNFRWGIDDAGALIRSGRVQTCHA